jgi:hypothetical protein
VPLRSSPNVTVSVDNETSSNYTNDAINLPSVKDLPPFLSLTNFINAFNITLHKIRGER